jgi:arylsulfatase A-like enzyme
MSRNGDFVIGRTHRESTPWLEPLVRPSPSAPNVLLVVLDDVGFAHFGCYGSTIATPSIDRLAMEGRRYNNFHTTAMCSPTRASLLTGWNHHAVGMGIIADMCTGYPGYLGEVRQDVPMLPEILRNAGYSTFALGKWHLTRARDMTSAGPFRQWPLGRGFERYYGFLYSLVDQWHPELVRDNHFIETPRDPGYHLSEDLAEQTLAMIRDAKAADPERPFFAYLAFGACHSPHQAPREWIDRYRGQFDEGWDVTRERWLARQIEMGITPPGTRLTPRNEHVAAWESLTADEKRVCARHQEVFAGFLAHTDAQIGRVIDALRVQNLLDDTLVIVLSDNGASAEGGAIGNINLRRHFQQHPETLAEHVDALDSLGSDEHWNTYPAGWGHAGNTPHRWFKMQTHGGGVRDPLIVRWPKQIRQGGQISSQFCHCSDIAPTILEAAGLEAKMQGTSIAYTFDEPRAATRKPAQYFELMGNRGFWADGWKAVARHHPGNDYATDRWELYHLDEDFSEAEDLAAVYPERLAELQRRWEGAAHENQVFPLDDRNIDRLPYTYYLSPRRHWRYQSGMGRVSGYAAPTVGNRSYRIRADIETSRMSEGVILAVGGQAGGYVLYLLEGRLVHEYVGPARRSILESPTALPPGRHTVTFDFRKTGKARGHARLLCDGALLAEQSMEDMWPSGPTSGGVTCGFDDGSPVSRRYAMPGRCTATILSVEVESADDFAIDPGLETHIALSED